MTRKRIALFGGSFNPPTVFHRAIGEELARVFDEVIVLPCGPRPDKLTTSDIDPVHRAAMVDLAFRGIPGLTVDHSDLELDTFTRTADLDAEYGKQGEVWHVVGSDLIMGGVRGESAIHRWQRGAELWARANFAVVERPGYSIAAIDLPPNHQIIRTPNREGSSSEVRRRVADHQPIDGLVTPEVAAYISRYPLYGAALPPGGARLELVTPRLLVVADSWNTAAVEAGKRLTPLIDDRHPNLIAVLGGDGTMLRAVREHWRRRVPFLGVNFGTRGYLLNTVDPAALTAGFFASQFVVHHLPLLYFEARDWSDRKQSGLAMNEVRVERSSTVAVWVEVKRDGVVLHPKVMADGVMVSTAAGSSGYAQKAGVPPLPIDVPKLVLAGVASSITPSFHDLRSEITFTNLDPTDPPKKRPLRAVSDNVDLGQAAHVTVRASRVAAAEIVFLAGQDLHAKRLG